MEDDFFSCTFLREVSLSFQILADMKISYHMEISFFAAHMNECFDKKTDDSSTKAQFNVAYVSCSSLRSLLYLVI